MRVIKTQKLGSEKIAVNANTLLTPMAVSANGYISELPDGKMIQVPFAAVKSVTQSEGVIAFINSGASKPVL